MGTRSLLAVETKKNKYHVQYLQFDGYPSLRGHEFYLDVFKCLSQCPSHFVNLHNRPKAEFHKMVKGILNVYQYKSGHSIGHQFVSSPKKWKGENCGQEWQYLWDLRGNFSFFRTGDNATYIIPWELTFALANEFKIHQFENPIEIKKVNETVKTTFFAEFFNKVERAFKRGNNFPILLVRKHQVLAFKQQGKDGWRNVLVIYDGSDNTIKSMFADYDAETRNDTYIQARVEGIEQAELVGEKKEEEVVEKTT